jgi:hypothetical protein
LSFGRNGNGAAPDEQAPYVCAAGMKFDEIVPLEFYTFGKQKDTGDWYAWGTNTYGQLGIGTTSAYEDTPQKVDIKFDSIWGCGNATWGIKDGKVYSTGANSTGRLGLGDTTDRSSFEEVSGIINASEIVSSLYDVAVLTSDNKMYVAGNNTYGQLGLGPVGQVKTLTHSRSNVSSIIALTGENTHYISTAGTLFGAGNVNRLGRDPAVIWQSENTFVDVSQGRVYTEGFGNRVSLFAKSGGAWYGYGWMPYINQVPYFGGSIDYTVIAWGLGSPTSTHFMESVGHSDDMFMRGGVVLHSDGATFSYWGHDPLRWSDESSLPEKNGNTTKQTVPSAW